MKVSTSEFRKRSGTFIDRAAAGEEILITKRGTVKARLLPAKDMDVFDPIKQSRVMANITRIRNQLAKSGKFFSRADIKNAIQKGRR